MILAPPPRRFTVPDRRPQSRWRPSLDTLLANPLYRPGAGPLYKAGAGPLYGDPEACECCENPCPICPGTTPSTVTVGIGGMDASGCFSGGSCSESTDPLWDGVILQSGTSCTYQTSAAGLPGPRSIGGTSFFNAIIQYEWNPGPPPGDCYYQMFLFCAAFGGLIWEGRKYTGLPQPTGTYTRVSGCDLSATLGVS